MRLRMTMPGRRSRRRWAHCAAPSRMMSMGARAERLLTSRLADLERQLDEAHDKQVAAALWAEYYVAIDLWLRLRAPAPSSTPSLTKATLEERFNSTRPRR